MTHEIKTTITGKKYHITIAKPVSIVSIERKYVKDTVVMPRVHRLKTSRESVSAMETALCALRFGAKPT